MGRGRPRHDDILTPREWEVLALIHEGLTNEQIASRLSISENTAKYHVAHILAKLGVNSREEAAKWRPGTAPWGKVVPGFAVASLRHFSLAGAAKALGGAVIVAAGVGLTLLGLGVFASHRPPAAGLSIAAGPLGKVAYISGGNLWVQPLPSGSPVMIASGVASPSWSPSGDWLLVTRGSQPQDVEHDVMRSDGSQIHQLFGTTVVWSPNADRLTYVARTDGSMVVEDADGSGKRTLARASMRPANAPADWRGAALSDLAWSPDGKSVAFGVRESFLRPGDPTPVICPTPMLPTPGPTLRPENPPLLFTPSGPPPPPPTPCAGSQPTARRASFYSGIWVVDLLNGSLRSIDDNGVFNSSGSYARLVVNGWTPDGQSVLFRIDPSFSASALSDSLAIYSIPLAGGQPRQLDQGSLMRSEFAATSPDGRKMALSEGGNRSTWSRKRIAVVDLTSGTMSYLTDSDSAALSPAWSPDGRRIAYIAAPDIGDVPGGDTAKDGIAQRRLWLMNADGTGKVQLANDARYRDEEPQWSRDGGSILFVRLDGEGQSSLWQVPAAGGATTKLIADLSRPLSPLDGPVWFGYYGYVDWSQLFDWWQAP